MKKLIIEGIKNGNNAILIDKYKFIFGFDMNTKFFIRNYLKKYFDKDSKSEYEIEKSIKSNVLINEKFIDLKQYTYVELYDLYDVKDDFKMGTKSLILKYYDLYLDKIEYNDLFITTNNLLKSLEEDINLNIGFNDFNVNGLFIDLSKKSLLKMIELNILKEELEISPYILTYEEILILQLELIKKIAKLDHNKEYIALIEVPIISNALVKSIIHDIDNLNILVFSCIVENSIKIDIDSIAIINNDIIDLYDDEQLYEISINSTKNISITELKEQLKNEHILLIKEVVKNKNI